MLTTDSPDWPKHWPKTYSLDDSYVLLPQLPLISNEHINRAPLETYDIPIDEPSEFVHYARSRNSPDLPFSKTKFCQDLKEYFNADLVSKYSRMDPWTVYDWHRDVDRPFCINTLIVQPSSGAVTLHRRRINRLVYNIREVVYTPMQPLLFNSSIPHIVINNSNQVRYIMSISLFGTNLSWKDAKAWLTNYRIDSYGDEFGAP